ncbi:hypothetical protein GCM10009007_02660 [Formosimonas limnophila]|uniref:Uncharacterized protein n=1 Tax=Formosimonas limnophila TaxID=1384487 RepID=A0A8J3CLW1_9BURK|nr:hypothetical protein [Formosimonas limnophila]GHA65522.1 hypothetical protein GCM10009007_02660 [Formosimonas limnophila]
MDEIKQTVSFFQGVYTLIIGLSVTEAIRSLVLKEGQSDLKSSVLKLDHLPSLVGFFCIVLPFYQGMGRHFFSVYINNIEHEANNYSVTLMIDALFFLIEASVMFFMSTLLAKDRWRLFFGAIILLMILDSLWAFNVWLFTEDGYFKYWTFLKMNALLGCLITIPLLVLCKQGKKIDNYAIYYGMTVNILVAVVNYSVNWNWYFPPAIRMQ